MGTFLLNEFTRYLETHHIRDVYCLPYAYLDAFYAAAGFKRVPANEVPDFLKERMRTYDASGTLYLCMKRQ